MGTVSVATVQLKKAAYARFYDGLPWDRCAERGDMSKRHLHRLRKTSRWQRVVAELLKRMEDEELPTATGTLLRQALRGDANAAKTLYQRYHAARQELTGKDGKPVQIEIAGEDVKSFIQTLGQVIHEHVSNPDERNAIIRALGGAEAEADGHGPGGGH